MSLRHPIHPLFVHFPIALWSVSLLWDAVGWWRGEALWWQMSYWSLVLGSVMAAFAAVAGFRDYLRIDAGAPALSTASAHMLLMITATTAFVAGLVVRAVAGAALPPSPIAVGLSLFGLAFLVAGGWLGGILVYQHGVGRQAS